MARLFLQAEKKSSKVATKGAKRIVEENVATLNFYRNMIFVAIATYLCVMIVFFSFSALEIFLTIFSGLVYLGSYQFMLYMAKPKYGENNQLLESGIDLNMEGSVAEHFKDLIILTAGIQVLSLGSNYLWLLWLLAPVRIFWILWSKVLAPWFFSAPQEEPEMDEKKQRKLERKMAKRH